MSEKYYINNEDATIQPKLGYRFMVTFDGFGKTGSAANRKKLTAYVNNVTPADFQQDSVQVDAYVSRFYVVGKHTIGTLSIELRNDAANIVAAMVQEQIDKQYDANAQSHAPSAGDVKFSVTISMLDGTSGQTATPTIIEKIQYVGCWVNNVNWGSYNYGSSEVTNIGLTIQVDNFYHLVKNGGGTEVNGQRNTIAADASGASSSTVKTPSITSSENRVSST